MKILHVTCSPRGPDSESIRLSRKIVAHLLRNEPEAIVVNRALGDGAIAHVDANYALSQHSLTAEVAQKGTILQSDELIDEVESADILVIGTPMNNYSIPSVLKAWIDHVVRVKRTFNVTRQGKVGTLRDRPVFIAVASGGRFSGERARQPDFLTPYLTAILGMIGLHDVTFFTVQGTGLGAEVLAAATTATDQALEEYFSTYSLASHALV
jgi:FMN-dependent NADH-azoreductase